MTRIPWLHNRQQEMHDIAKQRYELVRFSLASYGVVVKEVRARKERKKKPNELKSVRKKAKEQMEKQEK